MTASLVKPVTCKGCGGKGYIILASGSIGHHFICDGTGQVESDRKTIAATKARIAHRGRIISSLQDLATKENRYRISHAIDGFDMLGRMEPARQKKAEASILAGRPDVLLALADYYVENRAKEEAERTGRKVAEAATDSTNDANTNSNETTEA